MSEQITYTLIQIIAPGWAYPGFFIYNRGRIFLWRMWVHWSTYSFLL